MWRWAAVLAAFLLITSSRPASACSCMPLTKAQTAESATAIFTGEVTGLSTPFFQVFGCGSSADAVAVSMRVETVYKGDVARNVVVETAISGASCGYTFEAGKRYTVFGTPNDGHIDTGLCRGNVDGAIVAAEYGLGGGRPPR